MPSVSVVVPSYNRGGVLVETLEYLLRCEGDYEIIVVDQSDPPNETARQLALAHPETIRYHLTDTPGLPLARNTGIGLAQYPVVLFCDDDIIPTPGLIVSHGRHYDEAHVGGVAGRVVPPDYRSAPPEQPRTGRISRLTGNQTDDFDAIAPDAVDHGQGCNISFRKRLIQDLGGFDTRFGGSAFLEETDACLRVKRAGYQIVFDPEAEAVHLKETTGGCRPRNPEHWFWWYGHNYTLLMLKHYLWWAWPFVMLFRLGNITVGALRERSAGIFFRGILGIQAGLRSYYRKAL